MRVTQMAQVFYVDGWVSADDEVTLTLLDLREPLAGLQVLDVACGHGRITRELARRGADIAGIDISGALITKAQQAERAQPLGIRYLHADVTVPGVVPGAAFDVATCSFGLSDIDDLGGAIAAVSAALRPGGHFVFSILHPAFPGGKDISGSWPPAGSCYGEGLDRAGRAVRTAPPGRGQSPDAVDIPQHAPATAPVAPPGRRATARARLGPGA